MTTKIYEGKVLAEWVDYNGHMNDAEYARVFSHSIDQLMIEIGIDDTYQKEQSYTIYTLENHLCYLDEAHKGDPIHVTLQLLDYNDKLLHVFFTMKNEKGEKLATSEQMLIGINKETGRAGSFPSEIDKKVQLLAKKHRDLPIPKEVGRTIGIKRK